MDDYKVGLYKRTTRRENLLQEINVRNRNEFRKHQAEMFYQGYSRDTAELPVKIYARYGARSS